ncbi:N-acetylglucosamine kinase [Nonomuraea sp. WAC 01424]|uniref:N-acetylglucosamine kinase n=1 Tax=Nonomuraea sp. WAC 01424 TaxID=2203200 RepID=UPI00163B7287|nr:BadF/BadG/BcrA/BcrD ATPase family protein [Nonomuraea sp. WAC 01424]
MTKSLVVGVDAGATSTRVSVHTLDGTRVGYARAGAGNPSAHGLDKAVAAVGTALGHALGSHDGGQVVASLAGVAGQVETLVPELARVWAAHGVQDGPRIERDVAVAYAAGTPEPDGSLLLSGTGAVAARVTGHRIHTIADGLGWLLGDEGSGFWIGRAAAKAVVASLDQGATAAPGSLIALVVGHFLGEERPGSPRAVADRLVRLAQADHMRLAALSALVSEAAEAGDPMALKVADEAADRLVATLRRVHVAGDVVLAGSVLTSEGPVRRAVLARLAGERVTTARDAAGAAAWLAAREALPRDDGRASHAAFTESPSAFTESPSAFTDGPSGGLTG